MTTYQIWLNHVIRVSNFVLILKKSRNFKHVTLLFQKLSAGNLEGGGKQPPPPSSLYRVNDKIRVANKSYTRKMNIITIITHSCIINPTY